MCQAMSPDFTLEMHMDTFASQFDGTSNPADCGFHRIPVDAVESHYLYGAFFVTPAAQTEVTKCGLDKVLSWFNRPREGVKVGAVLPMDEMPFQAYFGFDNAKTGPEAFYVAISHLAPNEVTSAA
jgi:hypothetical protein